MCFFDFSSVFYCFATRKFLSLVAFALSLEVFPPDYHRIFRRFSTCLCWRVYSDLRIRNRFEKFRRIKPRKVLAWKHLVLNLHFLQKLRRVFPLLAFAHYSEFLLLFVLGSLADGVDSGPFAPSVSCINV